MSIEVMYPSRRQRRSRNPLLARELRRQKLIFMVVMFTLGLGLLLAQIFPVTARADNSPVAAQPVVQAIKIGAPARASVRQIPIYANRSSYGDAVPKN